MGNLCAVGEEKGNWQQEKIEYPEWECIEVNVDSGAIDSVLNTKTGAQFPVRETAMSRKGAYYEAANGTPIYNHGERDIKGFTDEGTNLDVTFQVADVKGPLGSVKRFTEAGNLVVFDDKGGAIINKTTGAQTLFSLNEKGIYALKLWVRKEQNFQGQES